MDLPESRTVLRGVFLFFVRYISFPISLVEKSENYFFLVCTHNKRPVMPADKDLHFLEGEATEF